MRITNLEEDIQALQRAQAISEKYKDFKFTHELEYEQSCSSQDTNLCAIDRTVPISAGSDRIKHT